MLTELSDKDNVSVTQEKDGSVTIATSSANDVFAAGETGLFNALRSVDGFEKAAFSVNGKTVDGYLLPKGEDGKATEENNKFWTALSSELTSAASGKDGKVSIAVTVYTENGAQADFNVNVTISNAADAG